MIPKYIEPFLWSYDFKKIDKEKNKKRIITNVLNLGTKKATDWLIDNYTKEDIRDAIINPLPGEWDKKSLNLWSIVFNVKPKNKVSFKNINESFVKSKNNKKATAKEMEESIKRAVILN